MSDKATTLNYLFNDYILIGVKTSGRDFYFDEIICSHLGTNITQVLQDFVDSYYGTTL